MSGNPYRDRSNGQFTSKGSGGGVSGPKDRAVGISSSIPTGELMNYFHSVITRDDVTDSFVDDIRARGVQKPVEIVTDGTKAAIADGHHRTLSAYHAGVKSVPVQIFRVSPDAMLGGRGDKIGAEVTKLLKNGDK